MIAVENITDWRGQDVVDPAGEKLGKLEQVYFDGETDNATFIAVKSGTFSKNLTLVPLAQGHRRPRLRPRRPRQERVQEGAELRHRRRAHARRRGRDLQVLRARVHARRRGRPPPGETLIAVCRERERVTVTCDRQHLVSLRTWCGTDPRAGEERDACPRACGRAVRLVVFALPAAAHGRRSAGHADQGRRARARPRSPPRRTTSRPTATSRRSTTSPARRTATGSSTRCATRRSSTAAIRTRRA